MVIEDKFIVLGADIETDIINITKPEINTIGVSNGNADIFFDSAYDFMDFVASAKHDTIFVFHNMQFDVSLILRDTTIPKRLKCNTLNVNDEFPRFVQFTKVVNPEKQTKRGRKKIRIYFIDLMNFVKQKLVELMVVFAPEFVWAKEQYHTFKSLSGIESTKNVFDINRCIADIRATRKIYYDNFYVTYEHNKRNLIYLSAPHLAKASVLEFSGYQWKSKQGYRLYRPDWLIKAERKSYYGGIVYVNEQTKNQWIDNAKYYDFNSLYPTVMRDLKVPTGFKEHKKCWINGESAFKVVRKAYYDENTFTLFHIHVTTIKPVLLSKAKDGRNYLPVGSFSGWYNENELEGALDRISKLTIDEQIIYTAKKNMFQSFVDHWYSRRQKAKAKGDKVNNLLTKMYLNSAYGSFGRVKTETHVYTLDELNAEIKELLVEKEKSKQKKKKFRSTKKLQMLQNFASSIIDFEQHHTDDYFTEFDGKTYRLRVEFDRYVFSVKLPYEGKSIVIVASAITSAARRKLMGNFDYDKVIYCDTDSQVRTDELETDEFRLGAWKIEHQGKIRVHGKKDYEFLTDSGEHLIKLKGIPRYAQKIDAVTYKYTKFIKPREAKRRKLEAWTLMTISKQLKR